MRIKFYLKRPKSSTETAIIARISYEANQIKIYTSESILPKYWNPKTHKARITPSFGQGASLNSRLDYIKTKIDGCYYDYQNRNNAKPSPATLRKLIDEALGRSKKTKLSFFEYFQDFIDRTKAGQRQSAKGTIIQPVMAKHYAVTMKLLKEFNPRLDFDDITLDFYYSWLKDLRDNKFSENNIGGHIKFLKSVLNEATERGQNTNLSFRSKRFITISEEVDNIALMEKELQELEKLDLSNDPHLDRVRDLFLVGCYTGLRYSDFSRLTNEHIKGNFIEIKQSKTGNAVAIPLHPVVKSIIKKYGGTLPESISNQKTNDNLKIICEQVKSLKEPTSKTRTQGGMKTTVNYEKWEIVSTHTARRSFATNAYLQGVPTVTIMAITGHKTEKAFLKYIKVTPKEHAKIMAAHWAKSEKKLKAI